MNIANDFIASIANRALVSRQLITDQFNGHTVTAKQIGAFMRWTVDGTKIKKTSTIAAILARCAA